MQFNDFVNMIKDICAVEGIDINKVELAFVHKDSDLIRGGNLVDTVQFTIIDVQLDESDTKTEVIVIKPLLDDQISDKQRIDIEINEMTSGKSYIKIDEGLDDPDIDIDEIDNDADGK